MWNMMCDVMPTISEDSISQRGSQFAGEDANFEQLMVSMLDERDKLLENLRDGQDRLADLETKLGQVEKERDSLQRQISASLPQVRVRAQPIPCPVRRGPAVQCALQLSPAAAAQLRALRCCCALVH